MASIWIRRVLLGACIAGLMHASVGVAQTSEVVSFSHDGVTLVGTLALPAGPGPHPAAVLLSGTGPQDRDGAIPGIDGYRPFAEISDVLVGAGVAVLRYDDRGAGASSGDNLTATTKDLADDAEAALTYLLGRQDIDALQLGLIGHSEGAMIAPMVGARNPAVAFVVALAPPVAEPVAGLVAQEERIARTAGMPEAEVRAAVALTRRTLELNAAGDWDTLESLLRDTVRAQLAAMPEEQRAQFGDVKQATEAILGTAMAQQRTWTHWFLLHDATSDWASLRVPALAVFGGKDVQVDEALHRQALQSGLASLPIAARRQVQVVSLPDANHLFLRAASGGVAEYGSVDPHLMPELLSLLRDWVREQVVLPAGS